MVNFSRWLLQVFFSSSSILFRGLVNAWNMAKTKGLQEDTIRETSKAFVQGKIKMGQVKTGFHYIEGVSMDLSQAEKILNLKIKDATVEEIEQKANRLIEANDPKNGGSAYIASKISTAKNVLLHFKKMDS